MDRPQLDQRRATALAAWEAMIRRFAQRSGSLRRDGLLGRFGVPAHLWPLSGAICAGLALSRADGAQGTGLALQISTELERLLDGLERYWEPRAGAYASDVKSATTLYGALGGGDVYYDDNAWIGLALIWLEKLRPDSLAGPTIALARATELFRFAQSGWDPNRGGVYWVEQGRGLGARNHDRNLVSTAPNALLGAHLIALGALGPGTPGGPVGAPSLEQMWDWCVATLRGPGGLFFDKVRSGGSIDRTVWSYNQGSVIALGALLARLDGPRANDFAGAARATAAATLAHFAPHGGWENQDPEFNAIFLRDLLFAAAALDDERLRADAGELAARLADAAAARVDARAGEATLLEHAAVVQLNALAAQDPGEQINLA